MPHDAPGIFALLRLSALRRLLGVRIASQFGDGAFQGALVSAVLFNPTRGSSAAEIAAAFAVLLLPYSVIGPFAGALLDRWPRRTVIIIATWVRITLVLVLAALLAGGAPSAVLLVAALLVTGAARFVGSGLSAALPHTVPPGTLVAANALTTTFGAVATAVGGGYAIVARGLLGETDTPVAVVTASVTVFYLAAIALAARFAPAALGPDRTDGPTRTVQAIAQGLASGLRHSIDRPQVGLAISVVVVVRGGYGMATLLIILLYQHRFTVRSGLLLPGLAGLGEVLAAMAVGLFAGAVLTPVVVRLIGRTATIVVLLTVSGITVTALGSRFSLLSMIIAAPVLAFCYQAVKVCVDAIVQAEAADAYVGRVFALYDTANNVSYVAAFAVGATFVPYDGASVPALVGISVLYLLVAVGYPLARRALPRHVTRARL